MRVLVVDDDPAMRSALKRALLLDGYSVDLASDGAEALARVADTAPDALVLDLMLPDIDGLDLCAQLRRDRERLPILMLTARDALPDRVAGLDAGADDYLVKPFELDELLARMRALCRRLGPETGREVLAFADLELDSGTLEARRAGRLIPLTPTERSLLVLLLRNPRRVLPRELILDRVWGSTWGSLSNSLEVFVGTLRRKLEEDGQPRLVHTERGVGYVLREPRG
jgi:two-component system, OmpR family, response regulator MprA